METIEVHAKDFLVKWVNAPDNCSIKWQVKPLKKSINFSFYRRNDIPAESEEDVFDDIPSSSTADSANILGTQKEKDLAPPTARVRSSSVASVNKITELAAYKTKSRSSVFLENINKPDLALVKKYDKLIAGELVKGTCEVKKGGVFAFIFDNSFSKTTGKKVLFSAKIVSDGNYRELVHSNAAAEWKSIPDHPTENILRPKDGELMQGVLLKRRRKKLQGFTKRFFILNFKYGTLSYFKIDNNKLRGQMPIIDSIVSANSKTAEIFVDSGMEVWDLKALNKQDFDAWINAFNVVKKKKLQVLDDTAQNTASSREADLEYIHLKLGTIAASVHLASSETIAQELKALQENVSELMTKLLATDTNSIASSAEFYDASETMASNTGVVLMSGKTADKAQSDDESSDDSGDSLKESSSDSELETEELPNPNPELAVPSVTDDSGTAPDLYPLPLDPVDRQCDIDPFEHEPPSLLSFVRKNVGKDLSSLSMPVDMNEPLSILQRYSEMVEYSNLIDNALQGAYPEESGELLLRIASFSVTYLSPLRAKVRSCRKPFNPLLGETFELVREDKGLRMLCEKISHKPLVFALFVETNDWTLAFSPVPTQKFWGKTSEIYTNGAVKLTIRKTGEVFTWSQPTCVLKNIIAGEKYTEPSGSFTVKSSSGQKAVVEFAKGGMFSGRSEDLVIKAYDSLKKQLPYTVSGTWTESMTLKTHTTEKTIWTAGKLLDGYEKKFGFTEFAGSLGKITSIEENHLPPNDSRLRPDIHAYSRGNIEEAETLKQKLEQGQRERRAANASHTPFFFEQVGGDPEHPETGDWVYKTGASSYWERRKTNNWADLPSYW